MKNLRWGRKSESSLKEEYQRKRVSSYRISPYFGPVKVWQARTGLVFGQMPLYLVVESNGEVGDAGLHYIPNGNPFSARASSTQNGSFGKMEFEKVLSEIGIDKKTFFDSLEGIHMDKKERDSLKGLVALLKPEVIEIQKAPGKEDKQTKDKVEETAQKKVSVDESGKVN